MPRARLNCKAKKNKIGTEKKSGKQATCKEDVAMRKQTNDS
jgi:hypothetical protein